MECGKRSNRLLKIVRVHSPDTCHIGFLPSRSLESHNPLMPKRHAKCKQTGRVP